MPTYSPETAEALKRTVNIKGSHLLTLWKVAAVWPTLMAFMESEGYEVFTLDAGDLDPTATPDRTKMNVAIKEATRVAADILSEIGVPVAANVIGMNPETGDVAQVGQTVSTLRTDPPSPSDPPSPTPGQPSSFGTDDEDQPFRRYHPV